MLTDVPLAPLTTLRLGGRAARMVTATREDELVDAVRDADARGEKVFVLGGGSNVVVGDDGFDGLVVRVASRGVEVTRANDAAFLDVAAGEEWDALVARCVAEGFSGVECMSGIPGLVGATPIQNVGAYGQEVGDTIARVRVFDRQTKLFREMSGAECGFAYRSSVFKANERFVVVSVRFALVAGEGSANVRYAELARELGCSEGERASSAAIRETVLRLRRAKGMVLDAADPESVSAGSFFVNPIVDGAALAQIEARVRQAGIDAPMPRFASDGRRTKLSAGWLVERAGFARGYGDGAVGVSRKHALALVNRGGATTRELLALAHTIVRGVRERFGVELTPEPVMIGCAW